MEVRSAEQDDRERIRAIAHDSFRSSYSLSPQQIETMIGEEFDDETLTERLNDSNSTVLVALHAIEGIEGIHGFIDVALGANGTVRWLHVDPEARGEGIATALIERIREDDEMPFTVRVLEDAAEGLQFLEEIGFKRDGNGQIDVGAEEFSVALFTEGKEKDDAPNEPAVTVPGSVTVDGMDRFLDRNETVPGREAPFFPVYTDEGTEDQYGYFCSQCGSTDVAAGGLDRLECGNCGNVHLADEWDDAYL